jgi:hypothetical protein
MDDQIETRSPHHTYHNSLFGLVDDLKGENHDDSNDDNNDVSSTDDDASGTADTDSSETKNEI